jgi:hypothetical protein
MQQQVAGYSERAREARLRRLAARQGLRLQKSRSRTPEHHHWQQYWLVDAERNLLMSPEVGLNLEEVERWLQT